MRSDEVTASFWGSLENARGRESPGGPVVGSRCFRRRGPCSIPGQGTKIPQAARHGQKKERKKERKEEEEENAALEILVTSSGSQIVSVLWKWLIVDFSP